jgi:hypothetical protein
LREAPGAAVTPSADASAGGRAQLLKHIPVWRWLCFFAMIGPAWYVAVLAVKVMLWILEDKYFLTSNAVFHIIAVRVRSRPGLLSLTAAFCRLSCKLPACDHALSTVYSQVYAIAYS